MKQLPGWKQCRFLVIERFFNMCATQSVKKKSECVYAGGVCCITLLVPNTQLINLVPITCKKCVCAHSKCYVTTLYAQVIGPATRTQRDWIMSGQEAEVNLQTRHSTPLCASIKATLLTALPGQVLWLCNAVTPKINILREWIRSRCLILYNCDFFCFWLAVL